MADQVSVGKRRCVGHKKSSGTETPAGDVPYLPMELWTGILIRTPADDLVRFKCVCKAWYELIRSRSFSESHVERWRSGPISRILFNVRSPVKSGIFYSRNVNHMPRRRNFYYRVQCRNLLTSPQRAELGCGSKGLTVLASCDGLILICYAKQTHHQLLICNPLTKSYKILPALEPADTVGPFAPHPYIFSSYEWAMLRAASGQYKVCVIERRGGLRVACYILELQIGTKEQSERQWKTLRVPLSNKWSIEATTTKDGKVHWLATKSPGRADKYYTIKVVSLDILKEEFTASVSMESRLCEVERPFFPWKGAFFYHTVHRKDTSGLSSLWVLEDFDTMVWTECGNFRLVPHPRLGYFSTVIGDNKLLLGSYDNIYVFDLISKEFWRLSIDSRGSSLGRTIFLHTNSLIGCN